LLVEMEFPKVDVDFDGFMAVVDAARKIRVAESRKRAGFLRLRSHDFRHCLTSTTKIIVAR